MKKVFITILFMLSLGILFATSVDAEGIKSAAASVNASVDSDSDEGDWHSTHWSWDGKGTLTISGPGFWDGETGSFSNPWSKYRLQVKKLVFEEGFERIHDPVFCNYYNLKDIVFPNSLVEASFNSFSNCSKPVNLHIPSIDRWWETNGYQMCCFDDSTFNLYANGKKITAVSIPKGTITIPSGIFSGCLSLESVDIPFGVEQIGTSAFSNCDNLASVYIPKSVRKIEFGAFYVSEHEVMKNWVFRYYKNYILYPGSRQEWDRLTKQDYPGEDSSYTGRPVICNVANPNAVQIPSQFIIARTSYAYTGKAIKPKVTLVDVNGRIIPGSNYSLSFKHKNNKNVGWMFVKVNLKNCTTPISTFMCKINPTGTSIKSLKSGKKTIKVRWKKQAKKMTTSRINGYQIQYSTNKKFASGVKTISIKRYNNVSKTIKKLKPGKTYYVRIRTYKRDRFLSDLMYSPWSKARKIRTK